MNRNITLQKRATDTQNTLSILKRLNIKYREFDRYFVKVGIPKQNQGWIVDVSVSKKNMYQLLTKIIPEIVKTKIPFKAIKDEKNAHLLVNGSLGYHQVGKIISFFPNSEKEADLLAQKIIPLTQEFDGPSIPTDAYLGGCVYTRYGSFETISALDENNLPEYLIYDQHGTLVRDNPTIPFTIPKGISWPFKEINPPSTRSIRVLYNTYLVTKTLKSDVKGNVLKTLRLKKWSLKQAVVKEAKHHINVDKFDRDIVDRLQWQYQAQLELHKSLPIPKPYDFFEEDRISYLAMEYTSGILLSELFANTFDGMPWARLPHKNQSHLLKSLQKVIAIINKLHNLGYVHRDISPSNFIINKKGQITLIDLEGLYSISKKYPAPPFELGTPGFIAPEQAAENHALPSQDVYSLGALIFVFFTGLSPAKFLTDHSQRLKECIATYSIPEQIQDLIVRCLDEDPNHRPTLDEILNILENSHQAVPHPHLPSPLREQISHEEIDKIIQRSLANYESSIFCDDNSIWHSTPIENDSQIGNRQVTKIYQPGLYSGISGGLYTIAKANAVGIWNNRIKKSYLTNYKYVTDNLEKVGNIAGGLFFGSYGIALSLSQAVSQKLVPYEKQKRSLINKLLTVPATDISMSRGLAGQLFAYIQTEKELDYAFPAESIQSITDLILEKQNKDGSWYLCNEKFTGICDGTSGVLIALLSHYQKYNNSDTLAAITKGLTWLSNHHVKLSGTKLWTISNKQKKISPWLTKGFAGIALCYLKAFDVFKDPTLQEYSRPVLKYLSNHLIQDNLTLSDGLCGIGELFIEAGRILKTEDYHNCVSKVAEMIIQTRYETTSGIYWKPNDKKIPTISLMQGSSGIVHFLLRYRHKDKITFPIF